MTILITLSTIFFVSILFKANAVCPVCTVAVGAGVGLSRWLGIDDTISGLWVGALILSSGLWLASWLKKKYPNFKNAEIISVLGTVLMVIVPMYFGKFFADPANVIMGVNKLLFGTIVGSGLFTLAYFTDKYLRKTNEGKVYVPYQKVILPVSYLLLTSLVLFFTLK